LTKYPRLGSLSSLGEDGSVEWSPLQVDTTLGGQNSGIIRGSDLYEAEEQSMGQSHEVGSVYQSVSFFQ